MCNPMLDRATPDFLIPEAMELELRIRVEAARCPVMGERPYQSPPDVMGRAGDRQVDFRATSATRASATRRRTRATLTPTRLYRHRPSRSYRLALSRGLLGSYSDKISERLLNGLRVFEPDNHVCVYEKLESSHCSITQRTLG
jgi:hypothetical protein